MQKLLILISITIFMSLVRPAPDVRTDIAGTKHASTLSNWQCTITFLNKGEVEYTERLSSSNSDTDNDVMNPLVSDHLDTIAWEGTSCNCWVIVFEDSNADGESMGLWLGNVTGKYDLTMFNFLEDSDILSGDDYAQWNTAVSSYRIYCF